MLSLGVPTGPSGDEGSRGPIPPWVACLAFRFQVSQRFCEPPICHVGRDDQVGTGKAGFHFACSAKFFDGASLLPRTVENDAVIGSDDYGKRIKFPSSLTLLQRFVESPAPHEMFRIPMMRRRIVRIQLDRPSKL